MNYYTVVEMSFFLLFYFFGPHLAVLRAYSWLCLRISDGDFGDHNVAVPVDETQVSQLCARCVHIML